MAHYEIEIWDKTGRPLADIRQACSGLNWTKTLNGTESLSFNLDLPRYEKLIRSIGYDTNPFDLMEVGSVDIRVKRNGRYLLGTNVYRFQYASTDPTVNMAVQCFGYLNFYKTQYITASFSNTPQHQIMWSVINLCNQKTGGDYGIRQGTHTGAIVRRDRNYERKEVASLITQMSNVINGCDFEFTPDKLFNTYEAKGTYRPDTVLSYGANGNIQDFNFSRSIENVANYIYALGSGLGDELVMSTAEDEGSELALYRREKILTWNSVTEQETIDEHAESSLHALRDILELPRITLRADALDLSTVDVGDTVVVNLGNYASLSHVNGNYRIQEIDCRVDENDCETATLEFDDLDINQIINAQEEE